MRFHLLLATVLCMIAPSTTHGQDRSEGFCAYESTKACTSLLGISWQSNDATNVLESEPICRFSEIVAAVESMGLHAYACELNRESLPAIARIYQENHPAVSGIAWSSSEAAHTADTGIGHFVVLKELRDVSNAVTFDPTTRLVGRFDLRSGGVVPLLLVTLEPIESPSLFAVMLLGFNASLGSWLLSIGLLLAVLVLVYPAPESVGRKPASFRPGSFPVMFAGVVFFVACVGIFLLFWRSQHPGRRIGDPEFAFSESTYQMGDLELGTARPVEIELVNYSDRELPVTDLAVSCNCMSIEPQEMTLKPGQSQTLQIKFSSFRLGDNWFNVMAKSGSEVARCDLRFVGVPSTTLMPRTQVVGALTTDPDDSLIHQLAIEGYRGVSLDNISVKPVSEGSSIIAVVENDAVFQENGTLDLRISLRSDTAIRGLHFEQFILTAGKQEEIMLNFQVGVDIADRVEAP